MRFITDILIIARRNSTRRFDTSIARCWYECATQVCLQHVCFRQCCSRIWWRADACRYHHNDTNIERNICTKCVSQVQSSEGSYDTDNDSGRGLLVTTVTGFITVIGSVVAYLGLPKLPSKSTTELKGQWIRPFVECEPYIHALDPSLTGAQQSLYTYQRARHSQKPRCASCGLYHIRGFYLRCSLCCKPAVCGRSPSRCTGILALFTGAEPASAVLADRLSMAASKTSSEIRDLDGYRLLHQSVRSHLGMHRTG